MRQGRIFVGNLRLRLEPREWQDDLEGWEDGWVCSACVSANQKLCTKADQQVRIARACRVL